MDHAGDGRTDEQTLDQRDADRRAADDVGRREGKTGLITLAAGTALGVALGVAWLLQPTAVVPAPGGPRPPASTGPGGCPTGLVEAGGDGRPGPLVRSDATRITLCETAAGLPSAAPGPPRVLTTGVDRIIRRLNALETEEQLLARLRREQKAAGHDADDIQLGCTAMAYPVGYSLAVRYPDGDTFVRIDRNCGTVTADGRTRHGDVLTEFLRAYRAQQTAVAEATGVATPACPATLDASRLDPGTVQPRDDIARNRGDAEPLLPSPLAGVTACRYRPDGELAARRSLRTGLVPVRDLLNDATGVQETGANIAFCDATDASRPPAAPDVLLAADATGAVTELWVWLQPCRVLVTGPQGGLVPTVELVGQLHDWLRSPD